jgi:hypothetical protein
MAPLTGEKRMTGNPVNRETIVNRERKELQVTPLIGRQNN